MGVVAAACVVLAAVAVMWPAPDSRSRRRRVLALPSPAHRLVWWQPLAGSMAGAAARARAVAASGRAPVWPLALAAVVAAVVLATGLGGPVAGAVTGAYGAVAARTLATRAEQRVRDRRRGELLDTVGSAAADLRAGLPAATALANLELDPAGAASDPLPARVRAAVVLAERTGAPLAETLERIELDARGANRARSAASAQAAGSQATAWLLAGLPAGGLGLGYAIGTDPLTVLLHTPIGAACALGAVVLQLAGLAWSRRIIRPEPAVTP